MIYQVIKRLFDFTLCLIAVVVLSPIFLIVAIGIKLSSKGPVFYFSERAGKNKKPFHFYKFRSMHLLQGKDKELFIADADRLFWLGKVIRRLKIDELPQLINVIKGDMSIVGPRPMEMKSVDRIYAGKYSEILKVKPGLTSAASLYDYTVGDTYTDDVKYREEVLPNKLEIELLYLKKQGFMYDCGLIVRTIITIIQVLFGKKEFKYQPELKEIQNEENNA